MYGSFRGTPDLTFRRAAARVVWTHNSTVEQLDPEWYGHGNIQYEESLDTVLQERISKLAFPLDSIYALIEDVSGFSDGTL